MHMGSITFDTISRLYLPDFLFKKSLHLLSFFFSPAHKGKLNHKPTYFRKTIAANIQTQFPPSPSQPNLLAS